MPMLFYWPLIVWMGMVEVVQNDMLAPAEVKAEKTVRAEKILS